MPFQKTLGSSYKNRDLKNNNQLPPYDALGCCPWLLVANYFLKRFNYDYNGATSSLLGTHTHYLRSHFGLHPWTGTRQFSNGNEIVCLFKLLAAPRLTALNLSLVNNIKSISLVLSSGFEQFGPKFFFLLLISSVVW